MIVFLRRIKELPRYDMDYGLLQIDLRFADIHLRQAALNLLDHVLGSTPAGAGTVLQAPASVPFRKVDVQASCLLFPVQAATAS